MQTASKESRRDGDATSPASPIGTQLVNPSMCTR
jgi:hypothetical protein